MPAITIRTNSLGTIIVIRNPFNGTWVMNLTIARKRADSLNVEFRPTLGLAKLSYIFTLVSLVLLMVGCESPTNPTHNPDGTKWGVIVADHPKACIESTPVVPDTIIKGLESWTLKVGSGTRNRCSWSAENEWAECKAKSPDTLYAIDRYCPATLKARAELGGN